MRHRLQWFIHIRAQLGLWKGDKHPAYAPSEYGPLLPFFCIYLWLAKQIKNVSKPNELEQNLFRSNTVRTKMRLNKLLIKRLSFSTQIAIVTTCNYGRILCRFRNKATHWSKNANFWCPLHLTCTTTYRTPSNYFFKVLLQTAQLPKLLDVQKYCRRATLWVGCDSVTDDRRQTDGSCHKANVT